MGCNSGLPMASRACTLSLVRSGYPYISTRCERLGTNLFLSRLRLKKTLFMRGEEAAELFYNDELFSRENAEGKPLSSRVVAVELINVIRSIVAVARYMVFAVMAMHEHPRCRENLSHEASGHYRRHFIQEARRYYPFFLFPASRVKKDVTWHGYHFKCGWQAILDLYGSNHAPHRWESPDQFRPERFEQEKTALHRFAMIPQGSSDQATQHRCPGEWITLALQDLTVDLNVIPTRPRSRRIISAIHPISPFKAKVEENS